MISRRDFLKASAAAGALTIPSIQAAAGSVDRMKITRIDAVTFRRDLDVGTAGGVGNRRPFFRLALRSVGKPEKTLPGRMWDSGCRVGGYSSGHRYLPGDTDSGPADHRFFVRLHDHQFCVRQGICAFPFGGHGVGRGQHGGHDRPHGSAARGGAGAGSDVGRQHRGRCSRVQRWCLPQWLFLDAGMDHGLFPFAPFHPGDRLSADGRTII